jgi:hypothetical protein
VPLSGADGYERRRPKETVLYQSIALHWPAFRERMEERGGLPQFVITEFEEYLNVVGFPKTSSRTVYRGSMRATAHVSRNGNGSRSQPNPNEGGRFYVAPTDHWTPRSAPDLGRVQLGDLAPGAHRTG